MAKITKWTNVEYKRFCGELYEDLLDEYDYIDGVVYDLATDLLVTTPGLKEFIQETLGAQDCVGRLANDILNS